MAEESHLTKESKLLVEASKRTNLPTAPTTANFLEIIAKAAQDPNVDVAKMHGLLDVQERMMSKQAEITFNQDMAALQEDLPRITKDAKIIHKGRLISTYSTYENIDSVIRPLLKKHNFTQPTFTSKDSGNKFLVTGTLSHRDGHSKTSEVSLTLDASGAKNSVQAMGSTIQYGKRYIVSMLLNLVFEGQDDDGNKASFIAITPEQAKELKDKIEELYNKDIVVDQKKFLSYVGADSVDQIAAVDFEKAKIALARKEEGK